MIDVSKSLVQELKLILPTYLEQYVDTKTEIPCITYFLYDDVQHKTGDTLGYSHISYVVKVWDHDMATLASNTVKVDKAMRKLGYNRQSTNQQTNNNLLCNILKYRGLSKEYMED